MKYYDEVTFVLQYEDPDAPGNWKEYEVTKPYMGEWKRIESKWLTGNKLIDDKRVIQAMNRVAQNRNQARLGDERLKRLMDLGSNVGDLAMDQYQMAYKISQGGNFKTV